jgi:hypothetical protein
MAVGVISATMTDGCWVDFYLNVGVGATRKPHVSQPMVHCLRRKHMHCDFLSNEVARTWHYILN